MDDIPVWEKLNLSIIEAARLSGIGEKRLRTLVLQPNCPFVLFKGNQVMIKRKAFENYLNSINKI